MHIAEAEKNHRTCAVVTGNDKHRCNLDSGLKVRNEI